MNNRGERGGEGVGIKMPWVEKIEGGGGGGGGVIRDSRVAFIIFETSIGKRNDH